MLCDTITLEAAPTNPLRVESISVERAYDSDMPYSDKLAVRLTVTIVGIGMKALNITWGTYFTERKHNQVAGTRTYIASMPIGEHSICGNIEDSEVVVCDNIVLVEGDIITPLTLTSFAVSPMPEGDNSITGELGVQADFTVEGEGEGTVKITWGDQFTENIPVNAGTKDVSYYLPAGTHQICAEMI